MGVLIVNGPPSIRNSFNVFFLLLLLLVSVVDAFTSFLAEVTSSSLFAAAAAEEAVSNVVNDIFARLDCCGSSATDD